MEKVEEQKLNRCVTVRASEMLLQKKLTKASSIKLASPI